MARVGTDTDAQHYARYVYDTRGGLSQACLSAGSLSVEQCITYTRDGSGRLVQIQGAGFTETLTYTSGGYGGAGYYNGRIASTAFTYPTGTVSNYAYTYAYDKLGQMTRADHSANNTWDIGLTTPITYDANGNFLSYSQGSAMKTYVYTAGTNRVRNYDGLPGTDHFYYDAGGNVTLSYKRGIDMITYDPFTNLPVMVSRINTTT